MPVRMTPESYFTHASTPGFQIDGTTLNLAIIVVGIVACVAIVGMVVKNRR